MKNAHVVYKSKHFAIIDISTKCLTSDKRLEETYEIEKLKECFLDLEFYEWDVFESENGEKMLVVSL